MPSSSHHRQAAGQGPGRVVVLEGVQHAVLRQRKHDVHDPSAVRPGKFLVVDREEGHPEENSGNPKRNAAENESE